MNKPTQRETAAPAVGFPVDCPVGRPVPERAEPACTDCGGIGYTDAWTMDGEYNPTHCENCDGGRKPPNVADKRHGTVLRDGSA